MSVTFQFFAKIINMAIKSKVKHWTCLVKMYLISRFGPGRLRKETAIAANLGKLQIMPLSSI